MDVMSLDALRQRIAAQFTEVEAGGTKWRIGTLWAADGIALSAMLSEASGIEADQDKRLIPYYAALLSKTLLNEAGEHPFDSDEGRELLTKLDCLMELGLAAIGFSTSKKK